MIKKIKIILLLILMVLASLLCTSCHGQKSLSEFNIPENFDTTKDYEITFWAKNDTNKTQTEIYQKAIDDFEKLYPNIHITLKLYTDYGKIYNDVITNISTNTTPNVCITYPDHIATYATGENVVVSLDELVDDEKYGLGGSELLFDGPEKSEVVEKFLNECYIDDTLYALPYMRSTEALYINKTYVEKLGYEVPDVVTWDFIWEVSSKAMEKDENGLYKVNGQNILIPFIYKSTDNMMIQMLYQRNAGYSNSDREILIFNDDTREILNDVIDAVRVGSFSTFKISSYPANFLNAGQCIFAIDSTAGATWMGTDAPLLDISSDKVVKFETVVRMIPQYDVDNPKMISQGPSICIFNKEDNNEVLASWLFAQFLLTNDVQISYAETEGYVPVTTKAQETPEYQEYLSLGGSDNNEHYKIKIDATKLLIENIDNTFITPVFNGSASLRDAAGQMIENVTKAIRRKQEVDIDEVFSDVTSLYRLDQLGSTKVGREEIYGIPKESKILLFTILGIWVLMGIYVLYKKKKKVV